MRRTKEQAQETRNAILDAAETVFHAQGVSGTTLNQIAAAARVTRGAIYWHFSGKAALFRAMRERVHLPQEAFFLSEAATGEAAGCEPLHLLRALIEEMLQRFAADAHGQRVYAIVLFRCEYVGEMAEVMREFRDAEERMHVAVEGLLGGSRQLAQGWTAEAAATCLHCSLNGLIAEWIRQDCRFDLVDTGRTLLDSLFRGFTTPRCGLEAIPPASV